MQQTVKYIFITITAAFLISCSDGVSLQRYFVDNQESKNFISQDLPISMVDIDKSNFTEEQNEAYNSVKRFNILGYKANENELDAYKTELNKVKTILSDTKYQDLMEFSDKGNKVIVKYVGTDDEADEIIVFGSAKETGFGVVRVLGNNMSPDKMVTLVAALKEANVDENNIQEIMSFFK